MKEINEKDLRNVSGGAEFLTGAAHIAEEYCSRCLRDDPNRQCRGGWGELTKYLEDRSLRADYDEYWKCPFFPR